MISVCMATHNGSRYIKEQIDSILPQLSECDELVVSDDGSNDGTIDIVEQYKDPRIKLFRYEHSARYTDHFATHRFASKNFENAMRHAKGNIIFLCDQDDVWMPDKVEKCTQALNDSILVKHNGIRIDSESKSMGVDSCAVPVSSFLLVNLFKLKIPGSHVAFRKELLDVALPFPSNIVSHDAWLGCIASCLGKCATLNDRLIQYRIHQENVSVHKKNSIFVQVYYRIELLLQIIKRKNRLNEYKKHYQE